MLPRMTVVVIGVVVALLAIAVVVLVLSAKNDVQVVDLPRPPPPGVVVQPPPLAGPPPWQSVGRGPVAELLREGRKIEAIKLYREQTGVGLKEAKDAVEAMERGETVEAPPLPAAPRRITSEMAIDDAELRRHLSGGRLIEAIKRYRELTGLGLKESKDAIESLRDSMKS
jgi:ribosomal protein L7/L12